MRYFLWEMDTQGNSRRVASASHIAEMLRDIVPGRQARAKRRLLYVQAWCPVKGGVSSYPWNWSSGRLLPQGDLRGAARRMLRQKQGDGRLRRRNSR